MTMRLEDQIRRYTEAVDAAARPIEDLVSDGIAHELGVEPSTIEITVPLTPTRPQRRVPGWVWGIAGAAAVLLLAVPLILWARTSGDDVADTILPTTTVLEDPALVRNPANGHLYEAVSVPGGMTWSEARTAAESRSAGGVQGHLATFTSADEYAFVVASFPEAITARPNPYWLGGFQPPETLNEPAGDWQWVTGEAFTYTNWAAGEPNDSVAGEDCLHPHHSPGDSPRWNDQPCDDGTVTGFIVEYDTVG